MEAGSATAARGVRRPGWLLGLAPLLALAVAIGLFVALDAPGLERNGVPVEELSVERTVQRPGEFELHVRNDGPDPVRVAQVMVNDGFAGFTQSRDELGRLEGGTITVRYPWIEGQGYEIVLVTATGATVAHEVSAAAETPSADLGFYGLMALIGLYVGVIPVAIGMLWLPWMRGVDPRWMRFLLAVTIGLLGFLGIEALLEGSELAADAPQSLGGAAVVWGGAVGAYLLLAAIDGWLRERREGGPRRRGSTSAPSAPTGIAESRSGAGLGAGDPSARPSTAAESHAAGLDVGLADSLAEAGAGHAREAAGYRAAFLVALGIGLHNLGEGLAIGSAYAIGSLALGAALVVGFALHNATEGLAIVAPVARGGARLGRLIGLGLLAGAPAVLGAWIGASAYDPTLAGLMFGIGAGAIAQVIVQIAPSVRDRAGRLLHPLAASGVLTGIVVMYVTGLLVSV